MKKNTKIVLGVVIIAFIVFVVVRMAGNASAGPGEYDEFAECLTNSGVKMYGAYWCPHCADQKEEFGKSFKYVDYIECALPNGQQTPKCIEAQIGSYPTWEFGDGQKVTGVQSFAALSEKSGCELPAG